MDSSGAFQRLIKSGDDLFEPLRKRIQPAGLSCYFMIKDKSSILHLSCGHIHFIRSGSN